MKLTEELDILQTNHLGDWLKTRQETEDEMSKKNSIFCICGRLATGLHERNCRKFNNAVIKETVKRLSTLLKES